MFLLMATLTGVTFFACNDDDEKEENIPKNKAFIGTWINDTDTMVFYKNGSLDFNGTYGEIKSGKNQRYSVLTDKIIKIDISEYEYVIDTFHNDSVVLTICPYDTINIYLEYRGISLTKVKK